ncbi:MAG: CinA family nicotinamide mononucleotide deamidase-related protein, partial [Bdellovibrionales bacterium]|nr:CinA family nicotinamide mononucleotide deamidase-related protein [Bdellovibrionales bacterium]
MSIISVGAELLNGDVLDTNSTFLARELTYAGAKVRRVTEVDDTLEEIRDELVREGTRSNIIITTGGLGPTSDDKTREAIAQTVGVPLEERSESLERLVAYLERRGRALNETNRRQARFPQGATILPNGYGTADAFITDYGATAIISLPGPPKELEPLFREAVLPWLIRRFPGIVRAPRRYLRCFGLSEAHVGAQLEQAGLPAAIDIAYRPQFPEILLSFFVTDGGIPLAEQEQLLEEAEHRAREVLGEAHIISSDPEERLPEAVAKLLKSKQVTLAAAESCSGGLFAHRLVSLAGSSEFFLASLVTYSNEAKEVFAGVKPSLIEHYGAVSEQTAIAMARGARFRIGADLAISITGIAGPDGGSDEKPVGTV